MKEKYEAPKAEIVEFDGNTVITTSGCTSLDSYNLATGHTIDGPNYTYWNK